MMPVDVFAELHRLERQLWAHQRATCALLSRLRALLPPEAEAEVAAEMELLRLHAAQAGDPVGIQAALLTTGLLEPSR